MSFKRRGNFSWSVQNRNFYVVVKDCSISLNHNTHDRIVLSTQCKQKLVYAWFVSTLQCSRLTRADNCGPDVLAVLQSLQVSTYSTDNQHECYRFEANSRISAIGQPCVIRWEAVKMPGYAGQKPRYKTPKLIIRIRIFRQCALAVSLITQILKPAKVLTGYGCALYTKHSCLLLLKKYLPLKKQQDLMQLVWVIHCFLLWVQLLCDSHLFFGFGCRRVVELYRAMWGYSGHEFTAHGRGGCIFYRILKVTTDAEDWSGLV